MRTNVLTIKTVYVLMLGKFLQQEKITSRSRRMFRRNFSNTFLNAFIVIKSILDDTDQENCFVFNRIPIFGTNKSRNA